MKNTIPMSRIIPATDDRIFEVLRIKERYYRTMPKGKKTEPERPPIPIDEDMPTLKAIEEGRRDVEAGRIVPASEVRKLVAKWIADAAKSAANRR